MQKDYSLNSKQKIDEAHSSIRTQPTSVHGVNLVRSRSNSTEIQQRTTPEQINPTSPIDRQSTIAKLDDITTNASNAKKGASISKDSEIKAPTDILSENNPSQSFKRSNEEIFVKNKYVTPKSIELLNNTYTDVKDPKGGMDLDKQKEVLRLNNIDFKEIKPSEPGLEYAIKKDFVYQSNDHKNVNITTKDKCTITQIGKDVFEICKIDSNLNKIDEASIGKIVGSGVQSDFMNLHKISSSPEPLKGNLFPNGFPDVSEVKQGPIGNCFFISSLEAVTRKNPKEIHNMIKEDKDGNVVVRLFQVDGTGSNKTFIPKFITLDKRVIPKYRSNGAPWVQMIEKAYACVKGSYFACNGGAMSTPLEIITGKVVKDIKFNHTLNSINLVNDIFTKPNTIYKAYEFSNDTIDSLKENMGNKFSNEEKQSLEKAKMFLVEYANQEPLNDQMLDYVYVQLCSNANIDMGSEKEKLFKEIFDSTTKNEKLIDKFNTYKEILNNNEVKPVLKQIQEVISKAKAGDGQIRIEEINPLLDQIYNKVNSQGKEVIDDAKKILETNLPGKRMSGKYSPEQVELFNTIKEKVDSGEYVGIATKKSVGRNISEIKKHSNEAISKGLAGPHAYTVLGYEDKNGLKYVRISNPWGDTNRTYNDRKAVKTDDRESLIELSDISKRFEFLTFSLS